MVGSENERHRSGFAKADEVFFVQLVAVRRESGIDRVSVIVFAFRFAEFTSAHSRLLFFNKHVNTKIEDINETRKALVVTVGADEVENEHKELVTEFAKIARIPGFRPGKAPAPMVAKRFSKEIHEELDKRIFTNAYREGLEQSKLTPMQLIEAPTSEIKLGEDLELKFVLDIRPEFNLPEYKGLPVTEDSEEVGEEEIQEVIKGIRNQRADFGIVEREAQKGDYVKVSYEGKIGDEAIADLVEESPIYGKQSNTWEEVGSEQSPIPGLAEALQGMKVDEKKEITAKFPDDFSLDALKGKEAIYSIEVHEVRTRVLPELDEAFFETLGVKDLDELKERIKEDLENQKKSRNHNDKRQQISERLVEAIEFPLPESAVEQETDNLLRQIVGNNVRQGVSEEELDSKKEELFDGARRGALQRVKTQLILARIAEEEKIEVDENDFSRYIYFEAQQQRTSPDQIVRELKKNPDQVDEIRQGLLLDKTLDFLVENASVTDSPSEATNE